MKLRLADLTYYSADFMVQAVDGTLEFHEVKGTRKKDGRFIAFWEEDAAVKFKVVAELYPLFAFRLARKRHRQEGGGWAVATGGAA